MAVMSLGESGDQPDSCEFSRTIMGTSMVAVKSQGRIWIPAGYL